MNCDPRFLKVGRSWGVVFLPNAPDNVIEKMIGYPNPNKGTGWGSWSDRRWNNGEAL